MKMSYDIIVVGAAMIDLISYSHNLPRPGETIFGKSFAKSFGGKGNFDNVKTHLIILYHIILY
jgi:sugar/nucleoside kinase (ribokinase family)